MDLVYTQEMLDLRNMQHANPLKRQTIPCILTGLAHQVSPIVRIRCTKHKYLEEVRITQPNQWILARFG